MLFLATFLVHVGLSIGEQLSCPQAVRRFDDCITLGYEARKLKYCLLQPVNTVPQGVCDTSCKIAENTLYRRCGYRQCSGHNQAPNIPTPNYGNDMGVASDNELCTEIGGAMLERGGSGVDAAVAVLLCLGAVQPQSNGVGGGGFMVVHTPHKDRVINYREQAPGGATAGMYISDPTLAINGGLANGVPGPIAGYFEAHRHFGRLNWPDLFAPSISLLREGIQVSAHMERALRYTSDIIFQDENARKIFFNDEEDEGSYLREGDSFRNMKLAAAYQVIAEQGPSAFYKGKIARNIVKATKARGGIMTLQDLRQYRPVVEEPLTVEYRSKRIITAPPPASGHVVSLVLQLLDNFNLTSHDSHAWNQILESFRWGYAMRGLTGDKDYSDQTRSLLQRIRDGSWAADILSRHAEEGGFKGPYDNVDSYITGGPIYENFDGTHTTHVSVLGPEGDAVACTDTVNLYFGSRVMTDDGIILNNQMDDFSTPGTINSFGYPAAPENLIVPGKRPMSSSSPSIVLDKEGNARFVTGAAGGSRIITGSLLSLINALDWKMTLEENLSTKRIHDQLNTETLYEEGVEEGLVEDLAAQGYRMAKKNGYMSVVTSVSNLRGVTEASGDPRKGGTGRVIPQNSGAPI